MIVSLPEQETQPMVQAFGPAGLVVAVTVKRKAHAMLSSF
jgi:hypothetical protein